MFKTHKIDVRLSGDEFREIERTARTLNMSKSQYIRLLLPGGEFQKLRPREDSSVVAKNDESALSDIRTELGEMRTDHAEMRTELAQMRTELAEMRGSIEALLAFLREAHRIPMFREFRSRCLGENIVQLPNESDFQYLLRIASRYYVLYQKWPTPKDSMNFGPVAESIKSETWPLVPPQ
jgi:hypothetical protein